MPANLKPLLVICYDEQEFNLVRWHLPKRKCKRVTHNQSLRGYRNCPVLILPRGIERFQASGNDWYEAVSYAASHSMRFCEIEETDLQDPGLDKRIDSEEHSVAASQGLYDNRLSEEAQLDKRIKLKST